MSFDTTVVSSGPQDTVTTPIFGRTLATVPLPRKHAETFKPEFEFGEHGYIGDAITLTLAVVTYGQINGLAGDFYATYNPICMGNTFEDQIKRFQDAYATLAMDIKRQPDEAQAILAVLQTEVDVVNEAVRVHRDPSIVHHIIPDATATFERITYTRWGNPGYLGISAINFDHFGEDACTAYNAGHTYALRLASAGKLLKAYAANAFADHFLEDLFSAGHLRSPRRMLHTRGGWNPTADFARHVLSMHDEDCAIGLVNAKNLRRCQDAVQASASEIYTASRTHEVPIPRDFLAWNHAPTLESARGDQDLVALFRTPNLRRTDVENRVQTAYTDNWWFGSTSSVLKVSSWWSYPMSLDGPRKVIPWTGLAACNTGALQNTMVFYQDPAGGIRLSKNVNGAWTGGTTAPALVAGQWTAGTLDRFGIKTKWFSSMAASTWAIGDTRYILDDPTGTIRELKYDSSSLEGWRLGATLEGARIGTGLAAAVSLTADRAALSKIHVFHQTTDGVIRDCVWDQNAGTWSRDPAVQITDGAPATLISAVSWQIPGGDAMGIFYSGNVLNQVFQRTSIDRWGAAQMIGTLRRLGTAVAAVQVDNGRTFRAYGQTADNGIFEVSQSNVGPGWNNAVIAAA
ncbi:uncharacterized protein PHACADRAFT_207386 [Phanerochaete carnosa HHB-10118-sp]|uniref:Uncharacterized protein n=1 Tax=Phanerochaete carnosa (strain HHB-10118-sp) TaxID=650164 RepID=K5V739_PHACS|nr:uncharacterized protein PHACADRAFT_207386 [Phanerochaete carnosa HHB-10118-sp]EKM58566.1 hypothetical protein PHACADRAFT_207386 [Phanerochaete carnosa HHB-10118-sp]